MDKAYDPILQCEVDAIVIAKTLNDLEENKHRYQCLCCGEKVYLAAADSSERTPHFKHRRGNNDTECERYLGQPGALERFVEIRKNKQENIEFYFNNDRMTFEIGVSFTEEELEKFEEKKQIMVVSSSCGTMPFLSLPLNRTVFIPGEKNYFTITEFSPDYYVSFDSEDSYYICRNVMKTDEGINIFRVKVQDEHSRRLATSIFYTGTKYIGISENEEIIQELATLEYVISEDVFSFITDNRRFYGVSFSVNRVEYSVLYFFQQYDYRIETLEKFNILWPPVYIKDTYLSCSKDTVFVHSSFELIPYRNTSITDTNLKKISRDILKLYINDKVSIHEKNINVCIKREKKIEIETTQEKPVIIYSDRYTISDDYDYYLFDKNGCTRLIYGSNIYLSESDRIVGYKNGHVKKCIYACPKEKTDTRQLINDILKYHPQSEVFNPDDFMNITTDETVVLLYLESCYRNGRINTVIKQYIKEGLI